MPSIRELRRSFLALHVPGRPLLIPNPWDIGSAKLLESLGFAALPTTSSGHAATLGLPDGGVGKAETLAHASALAAAVQVPVSADLENGFGPSPEAVYATVSEAAASGLAGCSIEDFTGDDEAPIYPKALALERIVAAVEAAHAADAGLVLTARAENFIRGVNDLDDTIERLLAYQGAGADVLYAPGLTTIEQVRRVVDAVDRPVNVLARPGLGSVAALAEASVARISVGGAFSQVAFAGLARASLQLREEGSFAFFTEAAAGRDRLAAALRIP
jgi:2-methylisocitrate lyase-like PEP mutase family enzyme